MSKNPDFQRWIDELIKARFKTKRALAEAIDMTESAFGRGVKSGSLSAENLLQLARATEEKPMRVLRLAGKGRMAELIEAAFGPEHTLSPSQRAVLSRWDALDAEHRRTALEALDGLVALQRERHAPPGTARRARSRAQRA